MKIRETNAYNLVSMLFKFLQKLRFLKTLNRNYLSEYCQVGFDRKSYGHSCRVIF
jgi:hypothetical protein